MSDFIHLRLHSEFSIYDSTIRIPSGQKQSLIDAALNNQYHSVVMSDSMSLSGVIQFYKSARYHGIKPVIGAEINVRTPHGVCIVPMYAMNLEGYRQLSKMISKAKVNANSALPTEVDFADIVDHCDQLIALCGGLNGCLAKSVLKKTDPIESLIQPWLKAFNGRFYLEIHRLGLGSEEQWIDQAINISQQYQLPIVATNAVRFIDPLDWEAHEIRVCINQSLLLGSDDLKGQYSHQQFFKSTDQMQKLFADIPSALENSTRLVKRCNVEIELGQPKLPKFEVPTQQTLVEYFTSECNNGLKQRFEELSIEIPQQATYYERLNHELEVIIRMNYVGYFLIVADFILWAKDQDIPVGPGRGSGAGSLVSYCLGITEVDPITYGLLFERFLNPERTSLPDLDIDFCQLNRDRVIHYVVNKYGHDQVAQIMTFGRLKPKQLVRDVARVMGLPYVVGDRLSRKIPPEASTIKEAMTLSQEFTDSQQSDEDYEIIRCATELEGLVRQSGTHAGGIVIAPEKLANFCPLIRTGNDPQEVGIGQFDKDDIEDIGLIKFDFLGLNTLSIIKRSVDWANSLLDKNQKIRLDKLSLDDEHIFKLLESGANEGIFQMESAGMNRYVKELRPRQFDDIVAMLAIYRPGPLNSGMTQQFIDCRNNKKDIQYKHELMKPILKGTYGTLIYQEQVMQIAQVLSGFTLGEADIMRKAMGKKSSDLMAQQKQKFISRAIHNGLDENLVINIFDEIEKFAEYGFNKSHSVVYGVLAYQTAWLKYYHPAAFHAASMSGNLDNHHRIVQFVQSAKSMGVQIKQLCINESHHLFRLLDAETIVWAFGVIKGIGENISELIIKGRQNGAYTNFFDFCVRARANKIGKASLEILIKCGAFDCLNISKEQLLNNIETGIIYATHEDSHAKQLSLFANTDQDYTPSLIDSRQRFTAFELIQEEKRLAAINFHFSQFRLLQDQMKALGATSIKNLKRHQPSVSSNSSEQEIQTIFAMVEVFRFFVPKKRST